MHLFVLRLERDSSTRTYICTSSALGANVRINRIVLALRDSTHRTFIDTRTTSDTIGRNFVSHKAIYDLVIYHLFIYCVIEPFFYLAVQRYNKKLTLPNNGETFCYFLCFLTVARAARSWALGPVNSLSVSPLRLA